MFYRGLCSCFMPLVIIIDIKICIFIVGIIIFSFGVYKAAKSTKFKINQIVLSCHILIFHLSFFIMIFF